MNRTNLIFTHTAVFSVGIAAAMIANSFREPSADGASAGTNGRTGSTGQGGSALAGNARGEGGAGGEKGSAREDGRAGAKKSKLAAPERLAEVIRMTDAFERQKALMDLIADLGPGEFAAMAEQFRNSDHLADSRGEYDLLLKGWAKVDPLGALEYAGKQGGNGGMWSQMSVLQTWAGADPASAERWAREHFDGEGANPFLIPVIRGLAATDVAAAAKLAETMPMGRERGETVDAMARALFMQGTDAALAFPATIQDEALRGGVVAAIANRLSAKDPARAADWLASMPQGEIQNRAARGVADALARVDTTQAEAFVNKLKPEAKVEAARGLIPVMASGDAANITKTAQWLTTLAGTPGYDGAVEEFVWSCNTRAPEQSAAWIQGVSNPEQQRRLYFRMLGEWGQSDSAAMKAWVTANNVPADIKRRFLR